MWWRGASEEVVFGQADFGFERISFHQPVKNLRRQFSFVFVFFPLIAKVTQV